MVASVDTIERVLDVIERHVDEETLRKILVDLVAVPGNVSFRQTIIRMRRLQFDNRRKRLLFDIKGEP